MSAKEKAELVRLLANELADNVNVRENDRDTVGGTFLGYGAASGTGKYKVLADIRRLRRELMELYKLIEGER